MATAKKKSYYKPKGAKKKVARNLDNVAIGAPQQVVTADLIAQVRAQVLQELKDQKQQEEARIEQERKAQQTAHQKFLEQMYASNEPWVELQSWADTPQGVKVELEWNDAFVAFLKEQGIEGTDEDQVVQKWVTLLLMQVSESMDHPEDRSSKLE